MADQRPAFRFRIPWLPAGQSSRPSPRSSATQPTTPTPTPRTQTAATQRSPTRQAAAPTPSSSSPTKTQTAQTQVPPAQPATTATTSSPTAQADETQVPPTQVAAAATSTQIAQAAETQPTTDAAATPTVQTAEMKASPQSTIDATPSPTTTPQATETQNPLQPPTSTSTPVIPAAERPPFRPPGLGPSQTQTPSPQHQTSRTQSQPPSPSRSTSQPPSPARVATQSRAPSQPSTPPRTTPQPRAASLPSSPSRRSPRTATQAQPRSPSLPSVRSSEQTSSPPSPSKSVGQEQTTTEAGNRPTSPLKGEQSLTKENSQPSESLPEVVSSVSDIQETKSTISELPSPDVHSKAENISEVDPREKAPLETGSQLNEVKQQPAAEPGNGAAKVSNTTEDPDTPAPQTQVLNASTIHPEPESFPKELKELKPDETKEVTEVTEAKDREEEEAGNMDSNIPGELRNTLQTRGASVAFQSEQTQKSPTIKDRTALPAPNGGQTKTTAGQPKNQSMPVDNHQKLSMHNGEHIPLHKEIREDISKLVHKMAAGKSKQSIDDRPVSVVTLAGENRGATMHIGSGSSRKEGAVHIHRGYKSNPDESTEATTDGEESFKAKSDNQKTKEDQPPEAYINSNVQGINNSLMFNGSITARNPGVHYIQSNFPKESQAPSAKTELVETRKAEFNMTPSSKFTHEPVVRRRCLKGLFLESSDSDLDGTKPRSHGCRVGCSEKRKDNNANVL